MRMRKWVVALAGLLISASACYAAFGIFQTSLPTASPRVQKNLVTDYGATCDAQYFSRVVTTSGTGNRNVAVTVNTFSSGDVGKTIAIGGAGNGGSTYTGTIASFTNAQNIVVGSDIPTPLSSAVSDLVWATDATAAYTAFKAAYQSTTPVQLNLPGHCGLTLQQPFKGIGDLIVAGNGASTSGIASLVSGLLLGGSGQFNDSSHSLRVNTANVGDSCVIVKTQPSVTVSAVSNSFAPTSTFTASMSGTTLTVTAVGSGTILPGAVVNNSDSNAGYFNTVQPYGTAGTTGVGGTGTYAMSGSATFSSQPAYTVPVSYTASVSVNGVMTVSAIADGTLQVGMAVFGSNGSGGTGGTLSGITTIKSQLSGSAGGVGDYQLDNSPQFAISSTAFQSTGKIRVTLNSTAGLSTGDTIFLSGMTGRGQLPQRMNGLKWIKVINGTQIDLFQWVFDGGYTSGGVGGGDRTSLMPVGSKVMIGGWANQAYWSAPYGYPTNPHWFEYRTVTSTNSGTHQICFDAPLTNTYLDTWPQYNTGSQFEIDQGGPATLYVLDPSWETTVEFKDLALTTPNGQTTANGRSITWRDVTMIGSHCAIPTQNVVHNWINVNGPNCTIETDKIVGTWNISGTSTVKRVGVQSSSMDTINIDGLTTSNWYGAPKVLNVTNSFILCTGCSLSTDVGFGVGTTAYGASDSTSITNSVVNNLLQHNVPIQRVDDPTHPWSMSGGVITIPNSYSFSGGANYSETQTRGLVPGHYAYWLGLGGLGVTAQPGRMFKVVAVTQDVDNTYVQTNEAGGFPTGTNWTANGLSVAPHPAPVFTSSGLTGTADSAIALNGCGTRPLYSCANFTYTGSSTGGTTTQFGPTLWGELDTFTFTNNVPFTGGGALGWTITRFANWQVLKTDLTPVSFGATNMINTKLPSSAGGGTRTLTPSGATGTQSLDSLTAPPSGALFGGGGAPIFTANTPSDSPQVTVTLRTNQNLPP